MKVGIEVNVKGCEKESIKKFPVFSIKTFSVFSIKKFSVFSVQKFSVFTSVSIINLVLASLLLS